MMIMNYVGSRNFVSGANETIRKALKLIEFLQADTNYALTKSYCWSDISTMINGVRESMRKLQDERRLASLYQFVNDVQFEVNHTTVNCLLTLNDMIRTTEHDNGIIL